MLHIDKKYLKLRLASLLKNFINDDVFIKLQYRLKTGQDLNLKSPKTYNEKLQWMKLNYRNPLLKQCVDKYAVRSYVEECIGEGYLIPILGLYDSVEQIDFKELPDRYILKLTNGSSLNFINYGNGNVNIDEVRYKFKRWIKTDYFSYGREWAYKGVKNRIIAEKLLETSDGNTPEDHKFFCFNGRLEYFIIDFDSVENGMKTSRRTRNVYDREGRKIKGQMGYANNRHFGDIEITSGMRDMIEAAEKLSKPFPAVRVDFYHFDDKIYFGELTFYHASGYQKITPSSLDLKMGELMNFGAKSL